MKAWILAPVAAIALLVLDAAMDGPSEIEAAQDVADYTAALADGGKAKCAAHGRVPFWTQYGDLICRVPAKTNVQVAGGAK